MIIYYLQLVLSPPYSSIIILLLLSALTLILVAYRKQKRNINILEERVRDFSESAHDCFWEMDETLRFTYHSSTSSKQRIDAPLVSTSRVVGKTRWENADVSDPENDPAWKQHYQDLMARKPFRDFVYTYRRKDLNNRLVVSRTSGKPIFDNNGVFKGYRGAATDITTEYELKQIRNQSEKRLLQDMDSLSEGFSVWNSSLKLHSFNEQFDAILKVLSITVNDGEVFSEFVEKIKSCDLLNHKYDDEFDTIFDLSTKQTSESQSSMILECTTGQRFILRVGINSLNEIIMTITDVSILKEKESELLHLQKMEILGQITGGVAHDFNNLLAIIMGNIELLKKHDAGKTSRKVLGNIERGAQRAASLTQRLLAFARRQNLQPEVVSIKESVDNIKELLKSSLGGSITLTTNISDDICDIFVDMPQLETALLNLAINSKDAMPSGGEFSLCIENTWVSEAQKKTLRLKKPGEYLLITCSDTGFGMSKDVLMNATEPFYTTKGKEKGSGLGLSMVYGFVRQSGGGFQISSIPYVGTTICMYFPKAIPAPRRVYTSHISGTDQQELFKSIDNEVILIVEDTAEILEITSKILEATGYTIITAQDSKLALQILETEQHIDLLLSDIILPGGINGFELAKIARTLRNDLAILFMTGYTPEDPNMIFEDKVSILRKPFTEYELTEYVFKALLEQKKSASAKKMYRKTIAA
jgi:signal transduction histidine kinase/CheY-like chemotaxis protein